MYIYDFVFDKRFVIVFGDYCSAPRAISNSIRMQIVVSSAYDPKRSAHGTPKTHSHVNHFVRNTIKRIFEVSCEF